jgi:hypothetical protein
MAITNDMTIAREKKKDIYCRLEFTCRVLDNQSVAMAVSLDREFRICRIIY